MGLLFSNWRTRTAAISASVFGVGSGLSWLLNGAGAVSDALVWIPWLYERMATPWMGVVILALTGWLMWSGCKEIAAAKRRGDEVEQETWAKETAARNAALQSLRDEIMEGLAVSGKLARATAIAEISTPIQKAVTSAASSLEAYENIIMKLSGIEIDNQAEREIERIDGVVMRNVKVAGDLVGITFVEPEYRAPQVSHLPNETINPHNRRFLVKDNQHWKSWHIQRRQEALDAFRKISEASTAILKARLEIIKEIVSAHRP